MNHRDQRSRRKTLEQLRGEVARLENELGEGQDGLVSLETLTFLSEAALKLIASPGDEIFQFIGEGLERLAGEAIVVVSEQISQDLLVTRSVIGLGAMVPPIIKLLGVELEGMHFAIPATSRWRSVETNTLIELPLDLNELTYGIIPRAASGALKALLGLSAIHSIDIARGDVRFGNATLLFRRGATLRGKSAIEAFLRLASVALQRRSAERALEDSEDRYRRLVQSLVEAVYLVDRETSKIVEVNPAFLRLLGYSREESLRLTHDDLQVRGAAADAARLELKGSLEEAGRRSWRRKDGSAVEVEVTAQAIRQSGRDIVFVVARDTTKALRAQREKEALERQLFEAQKLEAIGQLAGGVAHEFNNLLGAILGDVSYLSTQLTAIDREEIAKCLSEIETATRRGAELTGDLLGFARRGRAPLDQSVDLSALANDVLRVARRTFDRAITLEAELDEGLCVRGDSTQLHQVLMNLCLNARDALEGGGHIRLSGRRVAGRDGREVIVLTVSDDGKGMDGATRGRIFEPFFTTKGDHSGTGLGLAVVFGIVQNHGGDIAVESEPGRGATFTITLQAAEQAARATTPAPAEVSQGHGVVLLVDDDLAVRRATERLLGVLGYQVESARDGVEALELFERLGGKVRVVLLDLVMPRLGGAETFRRLRQLDPTVKVLLISGFDENRGGEQILLEGAGGFLRKPFDAEALDAALRAVFSAP